jgi:hypothetical protein
LPARVAFAEPLVAAHAPDPAALRDAIMARASALMATPDAAWMD